MTPASGLDRLRASFSRTVSKSADDSQALVFDFTHYGAVAALLDISSSAPKVRRYGRLELDPSLTLTERKNAFLNFINSGKFKQRPRAILTWSDGMVFRQLAFPSMPTEDLLKAFAWDLKKKYYFNPEDNLFGYEEVMSVEGADGPEKIFNIFYCDKKGASERLAFIQEMGFEVRSLIPGQVAAGRFASAVEPSGQSDLVCCELADASARITVVREGHTLLSRNISLGQPGLEYTDEILGRIAEEIKKTIDYFEGQKYFRPVSKIIFAGGGVSPERLREFMSQRLELPIASPNLEAFLAPGLDAEQKKEILERPGILSAALGAVLAGGEETVNLVPEDIKSLNRQRRASRLLNLGLIGFALLLAAWIGLGMLNVNFMHSHLSSLEKEISQKTEQRKIFDQLLAREKARRVALKNDIPMGSFLKDLSHRVPSLVVFREIRFDRREGFTFAGDVTDVKREPGKSVTQLTASLMESPFVHEATVTNTSQNDERGVLEFEVTGTVKGLI